MFGDPMLQSTLFPALTAFAATALLRPLAGEARGAALSGAAIGLGFLAAYLLILGTPPLPPLSAAHKLFYVTLAGLALGAGAVAFQEPPTVARGAATIFVVAGIAWIALPRLVAADWIDAGVAAAVAAAAFMLVPRLYRGRGADSDPILLLAVGAAATAVLAMLGGSASYAQLAAAIAAAALGFLMLNWPVPGSPFGIAALLSGAAPLFALIAALALYTETSRLALLPLALVFLADRVVRYRPPMRDRPGQAVRTILLLLTAAVPAAAAIGVALMQDGALSGYGYAR